MVWKNAAYDFNRVVNDGYFKNFQNTMKADDNNNLSRRDLLPGLSSTERGRKIALSMI